MLSLIAAIGKNRELGQKNSTTGLPWNIPEDTRYFRDVTRGHAVIMGQGTFEVLGRPLPKRTNIVLTQDPHFSPEGVIVVHSPEEALEKAGLVETQNFASSESEFLPAETHSPRQSVFPRHRSKYGETQNFASLREEKEEEIFIIGGATVYSIFLPKADRLYITVIEGEFPEADVFFPEYDHIFTKVVSERKGRDENFEYTFKVLERE